MQTYLQLHFGEAGEHNHWQLLFQAQMKSVAGSASDEFILGLQRVGFRPGTMPELPALSRRVEAATGWQLKPVTARPEARAFFALLAARQFPIRTDFNLSGQRDSGLPGYFEDVFGYVPMLTHPEWADFLHKLGRIGLRFPENSPASVMVWRFTQNLLDYGFIREGDRIHAVGGKLLANAKAGFWADAAMRCIPLDAESATSMPLVPGLDQPFFFVADGFADLQFALEELPQVLAVSTRAIA